MKPVFSPSRMRSWLSASPALIFVAVIATATLPTVPCLAEDAADSDFLTPASFDDTLSDDWSLTPGQTRLLAAVGVVAGMVGFAALAASIVTRLGDRGPSGPPAPLADLTAPALRRRPEPAPPEPDESP
jgi:hypothetical protein